MDDDSTIYRDERGDRDVLEWSVKISWLSRWTLHGRLWMSPAQGKNQAWVTDWKSRLELQIGNQGRGVTTEAMRPTGILQKSSNRKERKSRLGLGQRRRRGAASEMGNQKDVLLQTYWEHLGGSIWWSPHVEGAKDRKLTSGSYKMKGAYPSLSHTHTHQ